LEKTKNILGGYNLSYIYITPEMKQGLVVMKKMADGSEQALPEDSIEQTLAKGSRSPLLYKEG